MSRWRPALPAPVGTSSGRPRGSAAGRGGPCSSSPRTADIPPHRRTASWPHTSPLCPRRHASGPHRIQQQGNWTANWPHTPPLCPGRDVRTDKLPGREVRGESQRLEQINSVRETNTSLDSDSSGKRLVPFVSRIEFPF